MEFDGIGEKAVQELKLVKAIAERFGREAVREKPVLSSWSALLDYCRTFAAYEEVERFHVLYLDKKTKLIENEMQQKGTVDHTPVYPREIVRRALELSATAVILVHNHPSGDPTPSPDDLHLTAEALAAGRLLDIQLLDHLVVGHDAWVSLRDRGVDFDREVGRR